jgi:hypothetical protein
VAIHELDGILAEMGRVMDTLSALPEDALDERLRLQQEQKRLRAEAAQAREGVTVDRESLEAELEGLLERWDALQKQRIDVVMQSGGGSQGGDAFSGAHAVKLNQQIDAAHGRAGVESRIAEIRRLLEEKE